MKKGKSRKGRKGRGKEKQEGKRGGRGVKKIDFPGGPAVKTPHFHCRAHWFHPWLRNQDPTRPGSFGLAKKLKKKKKKDRLR